MGTYEDWQIHTMTAFRPIKLLESPSGPDTNRTPCNKLIYCIARYDWLISGPSKTILDRQKGIIDRETEGLLQSTNKRDDKNF